MIICVDVKKITGQVTCDACDEAPARYAVDIGSEGFFWCRECFRAIRKTLGEQP